MWFPIGGPLEPCVYLTPLRRYLTPKILVIGHVTIRLGIYGFLLVVHWNHASILRLYASTVTEIQSVKVAFAHVKGQKFSAHAPCDVTCRQGVQNNHIFGIPKFTLPTYYTTFMGLQ